MLKPTTSNLQTHSHTHARTINTSTPLLEVHQYLGGVINGHGDAQTLRHVVNPNGNRQANPDPRVRKSAHEGRQALMYDEREQEGSATGKKWGKKGKGWEKEARKKEQARQGAENGDKKEKRHSCAHAYFAV